MDAIILQALASLIVIFLTYPLLVSLALVKPQDLKFLIEEPYSSQALSAIFVTISASTISTILLLVLGVPLAYVLARYSFRGKRALAAITSLPLVLPHTVAGVLLLASFKSLTDTFLAVIITMAFVSAPLLINPLKEAFEKVEEEELVARSLGASRLKALLTVTVPSVWKELLASSILSWARAVSEVGALLVFAYYPKTAGVLVLEWLKLYGLRAALVLSLPLLAISFLIIWALEVLKDA